ncbi:DNA internalization-related competence protein ComEC/Rec2 [Jeotgalibacillus soli]|uniref:Metallo-beta-lactamase domain-containing protein n=1 Tax=Jeotgalibacillus soli TaxID=889306 RepID=A0A0C2R2H1_9BACL|nr:DNA internalization-related competence protein ComEC/Rec2 [Jeotgalibacillus soli]KIL44470.1 hypothetical protein KP78_34340 [Jeotgalibacillus soli]
MKWLVPAAFAALLGVVAALSFEWAALLFPFYFYALWRHKPSPHKTFLFIICSLLFFSYTRFTIVQQGSNLTGNEQLLLLRMPNSFDVDGRSATTTARTYQNETVFVRISITDEKMQQELQTISHTPETCYWKGTLERPSVARNPHAFNYQHFLNTQNIHWIYNLDNYDEPSRCETTVLTFVEQLKTIRHTGIQHLQETFPEDLQPLAQALIFGDRSLIHDDLLTAYQELGVVHLLAISGMHVGFLVVMLWWIMLRFGMTKEKVRWVLLFLLPFYAMMTGASPPVVRAVSSVMVVLITQMVSSKFTLLQALCSTLLIQLLWNPLIVLKPGFQLSYVVSASLLFSTSVILSAKQIWLLSVLKVTTIAQLAAFPVLLWHFHEVSIAAFVTNLLFIPLFTIILLPALVIGYLMSFMVPLLTFQLLTFLENIVLMLNKLSLWLSSFPYTTLVLGKPSLLFIFAYLIVIFVLFIAWESGSIKKPLLSLFLLLALDIGMDQFNPFGSVFFIDVGQGDAILIDLPWGRGTYLIDTGGAISFGGEEWQEKHSPFSVGDDVVWPVLRSRGITVIDKLILTHGDYDHVGAVKDLMERVLIKEVWITPNSQDKEVMEELLVEFLEAGVDVIEMMAPFSWQVQNASFTLLHPHDRDYEGNNDSLVIWGNFGGLTWLFTGDLEEQGEEEIMKNYTIQADVLKVGHHGSNTSTSDLFLQTIQPAYAIISAGRNNRYGHPHPDVIERLEMEGATIFGTYDDGGIEYRYIGNHGTFRLTIPYDKEE